MKNTKRGFTLIELLVVVLIVGILAAVAVPQYQRAVNKSRMTEVRSTLSSLRKALAVAMMSPEIRDTAGVSNYNPQNLDTSITCTSAYNKTCHVTCPFPTWSGCYYFTGGSATNPTTHFSASADGSGNNIMNVFLSNEGFSCDQPSGDDFTSFCKDLGFAD